VIAARLAAVLLAFPGFTAPVVDEARAVPDDVERSVSGELEDYRRRSGNQVAVAVVKTTGGPSVEDYAEDLFDEWGVGTKGEDNGVLLLVALEDRRVRIEVGYGVEDELTDLEAGRIVDQRLIPLLRAGDVGGAVGQGTRAIREALGDDQVGALPAPPPADNADDGEGSPFGIVPLLVVGLAVFGLRAQGRRRWGGGLPVFWGGGGGGGGGGFGGGFGGGGGGGSGGGGASGGW
jgi:uncharacterized protein